MCFRADKYLKKNYSFFSMGINTYLSEEEILKDYLGDINKHKRISHEELFSIYEEIESCKQLYKSSENDIKETLKERINTLYQRIATGNLLYVVSLAHSYQDKNLFIMDLISEGNIGLMEAAKKFDYKKGYKFTTYVIWKIKQKMQRFLQDNKRNIRLPSNYLDQFNQLCREDESLDMEHVSDSRIETISKKTVFSVDKVKSLLGDYKVGSSLDAAVRFAEDTDDNNLNGHKASGDISYLMEEDTINHIYFDRLWKIAEGNLTSKKFEIFKSRYKLGMTLEEVGINLNLTKERVRQIEENILDEVKDIFEEFGWDKEMFYRD